MFLNGQQQGSVTIRHGPFTLPEKVSRECLDYLAPMVYEMQLN